MTAIDELFGKGEAIIAMAHFPPMPGQPSCDVGKGVRGLRDAVAHEVEILGTSGVDAVMFCNERDRPYRTTAGPEVLAVMASVIGVQARPPDPLRCHLPGTRSPRSGWRTRSAMCSAAPMPATSASETPIPRRRCNYRHHLGADDVKLFFNVTAELATPVARRDIGLTARSAVSSSLADAAVRLRCGHGKRCRRGAAACRKGRSWRRGRRDRQHRRCGRRRSAGYLGAADGCVVGTSLKRDGNTWNEAEAERVKRLVAAAAESGHWEPARRTIGAGVDDER